MSKWYVAIDEAEKRKIENEVHRHVTQRDAKLTNFVEVSGWAGRRGGGGGRGHPGRRCAQRGCALPSPLSPPPPPTSSQYRSYKIIYRRYAGLFFSFCVDVSDNELAYLEAIHLFVEMLDRFFGNVCELDLVFNFHKVYIMLDEYIVAGELQETSPNVMLDRLHELSKQMM